MSWFAPLLVLLSAVLLLALAFEGLVRPPRAVGRPGDRRTWWLLLVIAVAGVGAQVSTEGGARWWQAATGAALLVGLLGSVVTGLRRGGRVAPAAAPLVTVALVGWLFATNAVHNAEVLGTATLARGAALVFWVGFGLYLVTAGVSLRMAGKAAAVLMGAVALASGLDDDPWRPCDQFKCGVYGALLTGPFSSENLLAMLAAVTLLLLLGVGPAPWRVPALVLSTVVLSATSSRTSMLALACGLVFWAVTSSRGRLAPVRRLRTLYAGAVLGAHAVSAWLVLGAEQSTLSNRGRVWTRAVEAMDGRALTGAGVDRWALLQDAGVLPQLFPHNQLLLVWFSGGLVAVGLYLAVMLIPALQPGAAPAARRFAMAFGVYLSVVGMAEVFWNPLTIDIQLAVLAPLFVVVLHRRAAETSPVDARARERSTSRVQPLGRTRTGAATLRRG